MPVHHPSLRTPQSLVMGSEQVAEAIATSCQAPWGHHFFTMTCTESLALVFWKDGVRDTSAVGKLGPSRTALDAPPEALQGSASLSAQWEAEGNSRFAQGGFNTGKTCGP